VTVWDYALLDLESGVWLDGENEEKNQLPWREKYDTLSS